MDLIFNDQECQVLNFTDITLYKRLEHQEETNWMLKALNASVHHDMLAPLKASIDMSKRLLKILRNPNHQEMAKSILISSKFLMFHANDLLDQRIIENGTFEPAYEQGSVIEAINEIITVVRASVT